MGQQGDAGWLFVGFKQWVGHKALLIAHWVSLEPIVTPPNKVEMECSSLYLKQFLDIFFFWSLFVKYSTKLYFLSLLECFQVIISVFLFFQ